MSRVITISMICCMPAAMSVINEREEEQPQTSAGFTEERVAKEFIEQALLEEGNEDETERSKDC